jgi:DNA-binding transcriptional MocR family regulator
VTDTMWQPDLSGFAGPKYQALAGALRQAIGSGVLEVGARLPPVRDLAWRLGMTPGTVARAYQIATQEGLLTGEVGRGTFVAPRPVRISAVTPDSAITDLRSPDLPEVGQVAEIARALQGMAGRIGADWLVYPSQQAEAPLRAAVVDWLADRVLGSVGAEDIALAAGGQAALVLVLQACLNGPAPVVLLEALAYPGLRHAVRLMRAEPVGVEMDRHGMRPDALREALRRHPAQAVCLTPQAQNPTTACMDLTRRTEIAGIARAAGLQVIEDDCYSVAESTLPTLRALAPERTWYVGSLSKSVASGLRFGYVVCPSGQGEAGRMAAQHGYFALARPVSDLCLDLLTTGAAQRIRRAVLAELGARLEIVADRLSPWSPAWQPGVPFVWLTLPRGWRASTFARMAEAEGVLVRSADEYVLNDDRAPNAVRLSVAGGVPRPAFEAAIAVLSRLLASPPRDISV